MNQEDPLFIIGNPRSGTSLLRLMLTVHPEICIPPECHFFLWLEEKYGNTISHRTLDSFLLDLQQATKFETWNVDVERLGQHLCALRTLDYSSVVKEIYLEYGRSVGKERIRVWGDKNKLWKDKLPRIIRYFPNAKFLHIVRDGRDVATSFMALKELRSASPYSPKLPYEIEKIADRWTLNISTINRFLNGIDDQNKLVIKYEDLLEQPESILKQATRFLGVNYSPVMMDFSRENEAHQYEPSEMMEWKPKLNSGLDVTNIGKYKDLLTDTQIQSFNDIAGEMLTNFGYEQ